MFSWPLSFQALVIYVFYCIIKLKNTIEMNPYLWPFMQGVVQNRTSMCKNDVQKVLYSIKRQLVQWNDSVNT
jgi:hypothetical protein